MFKQGISFEVWGGDSGKYRLKDSNGKALELKPEDTCDRVANALANLESNEQEKWRKEFRKIIGSKFAGGGRIMANVGAFQHKKEVSPINCTVMCQIPDSMLGIMNVAKDAAITLKAGCGVGYDFSTIRPKGAHVFGAGAATSGVISFMKIYDAVCSTVMAGGGRRGAQMGCLDISHPDVEEFITAKRQDGVLRYFNCSVLITDDFMKAVEDDADWNLWFWEKVIDGSVSPTESEIAVIKENDVPYFHDSFNYFKFAAEHCEVKYGNCTVETLFKKRIYSTVKAKQLFDLITKSTYEFWEPGFILVDKINRENNLYFSEVIRCTNPCVTGDTRIASQYGMVRVKELYDSQAPLLATVDNRALDGSVGVSVRPAKPVFKTSDSAKVYKITTDRGYELKATAWHELFTSRGKLKVKDIKVDDTIYIQSGKGQFGQEGSYDLGLMLGWITGDGHFTNDGKDRYVQMSFWGEDRQYADDMSSVVNAITCDLSPSKRVYSSGVVSVEPRNMVQIKSRLLARHLNDKYNFNAETKLQVPEVVWKGTEDCVKGYLRALFQADGTVNRNEKNKICKIALSSTSPELLKEVQMLLSNFGIVSTIRLRRKEGQKLLPNGKGGSQLYLCKDLYELDMNGNFRDMFMSEIGFLSDSKNNKYKLWKSNRTKVLDAKECKAKIIKIEYVGKEAVYDTTQDDGNAIIFNGIHSGNCAEQPLSPQASCLLGSMILPAYAKNIFKANASFDFESFKDDIRVATRALDNVVEINNLPLKEMQEQIIFKRRHGLGFTGLGSVLNMLCVPYNSHEGLDFAEKVMLVIAQQSLLENIALAKEKGCAPIFASQDNRKAVLKSVYLKRLLATFENKTELEADIMKYGLRFSHATTVAPNGTLSLTWGNNCSNGIEPVFLNSYVRNIRAPGKKTKVQEDVSDYCYYEWHKAHGDRPLPEWWRTTNDLKVIDHLKMQAVIQKWCDSSISKTINVPEEYSFEDFQQVYMKGWKLGLKGVTTYRPNAQIGSGVLSTKELLEKTEYTFTLEDGSEITLNGSDSVEYDGETHNVANLFDALKEGIYGNM